MQLTALFAIATRVWPALAGLAGAVYFASIGDYSQALTVFVTGAGLGHVLHLVSPPPA